MRKRSSLAALLFLGILAAAIGGTLFAFWPRVYEFVEDELIYRTKSQHWKLASSGQRLPGTPDLAALPARLEAQGLKLGDPVLVRIFKREFELEVWMKKGDRFQRFATYPICMWSGGLGPKLRQGDRQAPEGFYTVDPTQLNPNSKYHRSFNLGFPNAYDRAHGRTGSLLMVHGDCRSIGCYAMTDPVIDEIWTLITAALSGGQQRFQAQVFPFRMTDASMAWHAEAPEAPFWQQLKPGYDAFEATGTPPQVGLCQGRYAFAPGASNADGSNPIDDKCVVAPAGVSSAR